MYERVALKDGSVVWLKLGDRVARHEIARMQFARWQCSQMRDAYKRRVEL